MTSPNSPLNQVDAGVYDADLLLKDSLDANLTTSGTGTAVAVKLGQNIKSKAVINVTSLDTTTGDETYTLNLGICSTEDGTYETVGSVTPEATGRYEIGLTGQQCNALEAGSAYARITWTLGGTTPILRFVSYLTKV